MTTPKLYDQEAYTNYEVSFHDSANWEHSDKLVWQQKYGDIFSQESLEKLKKVARGNSFDQFEIVKKVETVHRYTWDENENNEE